MNLLCSYNETKTNLEAQVQFIKSNHFFYNLTNTFIYLQINKTFIFCSVSDRRGTLSTKALLARLGRIGPTVTTALAAEARDLAKSVRAILEVDCE